MEKKIFIFVVIALFIITPVVLIANSTKNVDCAVGEFRDFSGCSNTCGGGTQTRSRTVITPKSGNGKECPPLSEIRPCNTQVCPVNCEVSAYTIGECSQPCGGGTQTRTRTIIENQVGTGAPCPTPLSDTIACNTQPCNVDPSSLPAGTTRGNYLFWDEKKASFQVGSSEISIGDNAGLDQGEGAVSIGSFNCPGLQDIGGTVIGNGCCYNNGRGTQGVGAVAIGRAVCLGGNQQTGSVAIGNSTASFGQLERSIAIGVSAGYAGTRIPQPEGQIHINTISDIVTPKTQPNALYIEPIRVSSFGNPLLYNSSGEIVVNTSSERYKTNIVDITPEESQKIYNLNPVKFDRINGEVTGEYGLIAERVNDIDESLVVTDSKNQPDGIHWFRIVPLMLAELRRLKARIDVLESNQLLQGV